MNIQLDRGAGFISIFWETWQGSRQKRKEIPPKEPEPQPRFLEEHLRKTIHAMNAFCRCKRYSWHFYVLKQEVF